MKFEWIATDTFEGLSPIAQVYGVCLDDRGRVMIIRQPGDCWNLPGGKPELGEAPEETLRREVLEETSVTLIKCGVIGYQKVTKDDGAAKYQLGYACEIAHIGDVLEDPATCLVNERLFVPVERIPEYVEYPEIVPIVEASMRWKDGKNLFNDIIRLLNALYGKGGVDAVSTELRTMMARLPAFTSDYLYPWYCLFVAFVTDWLHEKKGEESFFAWDSSLERPLSAYHYMQCAYQFFWREPPLSPWSREVEAFLDEAQATFVGLCWQLIDPKRRGNVASDARIALRLRLEAIPPSDKHLDECRPIFDDVCLLLAGGRHEWFSVLKGITAIERGEEWFSAQ